jgi:hypothetical protein
MKSNYIKIKGSTVRQHLGIVSQRSSVWRGEDHFLLVNNMGYNESYKRYYFRVWVNAGIVTKAKILGRCLQ